MTEDDATLNALQRIRQLRVDSLTRAHMRLVQLERQKQAAVQDSHEALLAAERAHIDREQSHLSELMGKTSAVHELEQYMRLQDSNTRERKTMMQTTDSLQLEQRQLVKQAEASRKALSAAELKLAGLEEYMKDRDFE
jgi:hypothetical protein